VIADALPGLSFAMIRPHSVTLARHTVDGVSVRNTWSGRIVDVDRLGDRVRVGIDGELALVAEITVASFDTLALRPGDDIRASVKATDIEVYPS
jgi:molybdate transport system ATP-binding protein